jgi:hypothetical protein
MMMILEINNQVEGKKIGSARTSVTETRNGKGTAEVG